MSRPANGYWRNGVRVVSNTEALSTAGVRRLFGSPADIERRGRIGSAAHKATAILDFNARAWNTAPYEWIAELDEVDPEVRLFVESWEGFKKNYDFVPRLIEHSFITKTGITDFATTIDREGLLRGRPAIVEIKTPKVKEAWWGVQLAGQELAVLCALGPPLTPPYKYVRYTAQIFADGRPGKLIEYLEPSDRDVFLWALGLTTWLWNNYGAPK